MASANAMMATEMDDSVMDMCIHAKNVRSLAKNTYHREQGRTSTDTMVG